MPGVFDNPLVNPDEPPLTELAINSDWIPFVVGSCERLLDKSLWDVSDMDWEVLEGRIGDLLEILSGAPPITGTFMIYDGDAPFSDAIDDSTAVNLGMRIQSEVAGNVTGIRIWRRDGDGNGQQGALWTNSGDLIASADALDDVLGWAFCEFDSPIAIEADTTYVISGHFPSGHFVRTFGVMDESVDNPPLHAIADGVDGDSGIYLYDAALQFPTNDGFQSNYFIDLILETTG